MSTGCNVQHDKYKNATIYYIVVKRANLMSFQKLSERQGKHKQISYSSREDNNVLQKLKITHVPGAKEAPKQENYARSGYVKC